MGTIVAARTNNGLAIGADCLNTFEEVIHTSLNYSDSCISKIGESFIGLNCSYALQQLTQSLLETMSSESISDINLSDSAQVRALFANLFMQLKTQHQVIPQQVPHLPLETLPINALIVNRHGIFKIDGTRTVYEHRKFWAIGSGEAFALGALHATYNEDADAEALVRSALKTCGTFEANRNRDFTIRTIRLPNLKLAPPDSGKANMAAAKVLVHRGPVSIKRGRKGKRKESTAEPD